MQLTPEQRTIIGTEVSHALITAVAGSGKTTTLAQRILALLEQGKDPRRVLVLMFNRAAKTDFEERLRTLAQGRFSSLPEVRTYHAMGLRLYRHFVRHGLLPAYRDPILSEQEISWQLWLGIQRLVPADMQGNVRNQKKELIELASRLLDHSKTSLLPVSDSFDDLGIRRNYRFLTDVVDRYEDWRRAQRRISFADMLEAPVRLMRERPDCCAQVSNKMDIMLVDEYQDTNEVQHQLLKLIAGDRACVTVVGDPDQTIYEFRGASPSYILQRFNEDFANARALQLTTSFRYGPRIAELANRLIQHNRGRKPQRCEAHQANPATSLEVIATRDMAHQVASSIRSLSRQHPGESIAVLFRVWSQAVSMELALLEAGLPYAIEHGKGALNDPDVIRLQSVLEVAANRWSGLEPEKRRLLMRDLLKFPHCGLKEEQASALAEGVSQSELPPGDALVDLLPDSLHGLQKFKVKRLAGVLNRLPRMKKDSATLLRWYAEETELFKGIMDLALTQEQGEERQSIIQQTIKYLKSLRLDPAGALGHFATLANQAANATSGGGAILTTIHRAKGLEWDHVIIGGLSERYMPYRHKDDRTAQAETLEAERRLLYVAITRCRQSLTLLHPAADTGGQPASAEPDETPSRFLEEMGLLEPDRKKPSTARRHRLFTFDTD